MGEVYRARDTTAVPSKLPPHVVVILNWPALMKK